LKDSLANPHSHTPASTRLGWALAVTGTFMVLEVAGGVISGSLALLADAGHMLTDTAALALAWLAAQLARRPTDSRRSYGYHRAQVLAAFVNALALFAVVAWILFEAVERLLTPRDIEGGTMLGVALLGLLANVVVYRILHSDAEDNINVAAARLHVLGDLLGSIGAMIAAIVIIKTGWTPIDPLLSVFVALLIVRSAWSVLRKSTLILMENAPETVNPDDLKQTLIAAVPGVRDVHDVHCWSLTTGQTMLTLHLVLEPDADPARVLREAKQVLARRFEVAHSALQLEREECPDAV
jgi:cobalt-zinc-cadmium efflux system protein